MLSSATFLVLNLWFLVPCQSSQYSQLPAVWRLEWHNCEFPTDVARSVTYFASIILRAFQGVGGSGIYAMTGVIVAVVVPPSRYAKYMAIISSVFAISSILGPLLGGAISEHSTWRWIFLLKFVNLLIYAQSTCWLHQSASCSCGYGTDCVLDAFYVLETWS